MSDTYDKWKLQGEINRLKDEIEALRAENARLQERLADEEYVSKDLEEMFQNMRTEADALRAENARLQGRLEEEEYVSKVWDVQTERDALQAENAKLREAGKEVVDWWLRDGMNKFDGAPGAMFNLRAALGYE